MRTWNYRVIRKKNESGEITFQIHEVYYDHAGEINGWTERPVQPLGESISELHKDIRHFLEAFQKETLEEVTTEKGGKLQPITDKQN